MNSGDNKYFEILSHSDKKNQLTELKNLRKLNQILLETTSDGYILADTRGHIRDVNPAYCRMVDFTRDELLKMTIEELENNLSKEEIEMVIREVSETGNARFHTKHRNKSGQSVILESSLTLIEGVEEEPLVAGFVRDITEKEEIIRKFRESEERWERLVENNPQTVVLSQNGKIIYVNTAGLQLYGADKDEEMVNHSIWEFIHPEDRIYFRNQWKQVRNEADLPPIDLRFVCKNGEIRNLEVHSNQAVYKGKNTIQSVLHDVTNRVLYKDQIEKSLKQKETLIKEIHHRVKNNMAVVSGLMDLQVMKSTNEELVDQLRSNQLRIQTMARIHENLYQNELLTNIDCSTQTRELVDDVLMIFDSENIDIHYDLQPINMTVNQAIPYGLIVNEIISNCLKHAFRGREEGEIWVFLQKNDQTVNLCIMDNGVGFPEEYDTQENSSLGITLIQTLAEQLEGKLQISNNTQKPGTKIELNFSLT